MKKFLINVAIFFSIVAVVDFSLGKVFYWLQSTKAKGRTQTEYHICNDLNADILVMGSSRASHHYVAQLIIDSLGKTCFNGGQDGNGIVMQYGRWKMISKHRLPKVIIYDIEPAFDLAVNDNSRYIDRLKPYTGDTDVKEFIAGLYPLERYKVISQMYRYNYKFLEIATDCMRLSDVNSGYQPNYNHIRQELINKERKPEKSKIEKIDDVKMACLTKLIDEAQSKGIQVILISSPYWKGYNDSDLSVIRMLTKEKGVPFIDYSNSEIRNNPDWFADSMHLNDKGARTFTKDLINHIKAICGV